MNSNLRSLSALLSVAALATLAGCAVGATDASEVETTEDALRVRVAAGSFKLYDQPGTIPDEFCDLHTTLELKNGPLGLATLKGAVGGTCEIAVPDDARTYRLHSAGTSCGSKLYTGRTRVDGQWRSVRITDHRTRTCRDLVPARVIVEETIAGAATGPLYSADVVPTPQTTWLTMSPRQCGTNPWERSTIPNSSTSSLLSGEAASVERYFQSQGIQLEEIGFLNATEPRMVCMACQCPRGDVLVVKAATAADAKALKQNGFADANLAYATTPVQCGGNPWEGGNANLGSEAARLGAFLTQSGAQTTDTGFVNPTAPLATCSACQCSRGDRAVVLAKDATEGRDLEQLGFAKLN
jgi:hypothetical protein